MLSFDHSEATYLCFFHDLLFLKNAKSSQFYPCPSVWDSCLQVRNKVRFLSFCSFLIRESGLKKMWLHLLWPLRLFQSMPSGASRCHCSTCKAITTPPFLVQRSMWKVNHFLTKKFLNVYWMFINLQTLDLLYLFIL